MINTCREVKFNWISNGPFLSGGNVLDYPEIINPDWIYFPREQNIINSYENFYPDLLSNFEETCPEVWFTVSVATTYIDSEGNLS